MAKLKSFTTADGVVHLDAVWLPVAININHIGKVARIVFQAFHSVATLAAGKEPLLGAMKEYNIRGSAYTALVTSEPTLEATLLGVIADKAYDVAMNTLDTAQSDPKLPKVSFFNGCTDINLG